ncbi:MAG: lytic transglycosylase F, partial [Eudoraea sp.]|nr:lytic transglycosylase F [Eudoraea sp.]
MTNRLGIFVICAFLLFGCQTKKSDSKKAVEIRDLNEIVKDGKLRVLIAYSATSYFLYRGQTMGYEYELLKRLAKNLNLELDLKVSRNLDDMLDELKNGNVDLVAHGLAVTQERKEEVAFVDYLYLTKQVLVQRKPDNWRNLTLDNIKEAMIQDPIELIGDTVSVRKNSSYYKRLLNLSKEIGGDIIIDSLKGGLSTDEIIKQVVDKKIKYTVADGNLARINASHYPILDVSVPLSFSQRIAWAVRKDSPVLLEAINSWINEEKKNSDYYVIYNRYFENKRSFRRRAKSEFYSLNKNQISAYDRLIKEYAQELGWDWRLLASLVYQESQFEPSDSSWAGAKGLMQIMPSTAQELG